MTLPLLVPLEWPVQHPSALAYLLLLLIGPMALGAVIALVALVPAWHRSLDQPEPVAEVARRDS